MDHTRSDNVAYLGLGEFVLRYRLESGERLLVAIGYPVVDFTVR